MTYSLDKGVIIGKTTGLGSDYCKGERGVGWFHMKANKFIGRKECEFREQNHFQNVAVACRLVGNKCWASFRQHLLNF